MDLQTASTLTPREYHARRRAEQRARREAFQERKLTQAREAIRRLAPEYPGLRTVHLFGSVLESKRFRENSDIDVAVESDDLEAETPFARALEEALGMPVDLRPINGALGRTVHNTGERVYERTDAGT